MYLRFDSQESFNLWHEEIKQIKGIPRIGNNAQNGQVNSAGQATENYSVLESDAEGTLFCLIDDADFGLTTQTEVPCNPVFSNAMN